MPLMSQLGLLLGLALLVLAGCQKKQAPEPPVAPSSPQPGILDSLPGFRASVTEPQRATPAIPFTLQVEPPSLKVAAGASAKVKVTAARSDYLGPIAVELRNLPGRVTAARATLAAGQASLEIEVTAAADAAPGPKTDIQAVGTAASPSTAMGSSSPFTIEVTSTPTAPFSLKTQQAPVKLTQGGRARVKITATRSGYQGPITVELRNLPAGVDAAKGIIPMGKDEVEVDLTATSSASQGTRKDVAVLGTTTKQASPQVVSPAFTLDVVKASPSAQDFTLRVEPVHVQVKQGGKAKVTVVADRGKGYQGPITVELRNLPGRVTASPSVIPAGKDRVSLDLMADPHASVTDRPDVSARGQGTAGDNRQVSSPPFLVSVQAVSGHPPAPHPEHPAANEGTVVKINVKDTPHRLTIKGKDGKEHTWTVAKDARITHNGKDHHLKDLKAGAKVKVTVVKNTATRVDAHD